MLTKGIKQLYLEGQRQLLAIVRAAVANPPVNVLDEATSSIDTHTEELAQNNTDKLMTGRTTFVMLIAYQLLEMLIVLWYLKTKR